VGRHLRVRIRARDVALALSPPSDSSFLNVLQGVVREVGADSGAMVDLRLEVGGASVWARITERSRRNLGLTPGTRAYALVKAVAIDRYSLGRVRPRRAARCPD
jgi:molybdate transport system ATP-binding protein